MKKIIGIHGEELTNTEVRAYDIARSIGMWQNIVTTANRVCREFANREDEGFILGGDIIVREAARMIDQTDADNRRIVATLAERGGWYNACVIVATHAIEDWEARHPKREAIPAGHIPAFLGGLFASYDGLFAGGTA